MALSLGRFSQPESFTDFSRDLEAIAASVRSFLKTILATGEPPLLYDASRHLLKAGGKMLRPYLTIKACETVGGRAMDALPASVGLELLHTFTLIHDDIMDNDKFRRGVPTVHVQYGIPTAIIAGDLLYSKVYETILHHTDRKHVATQQILDALKEITTSAVRLCEGQVLDISLPNIQSVTENDYMEMIQRKTAYLFSAAARVGAIIGGGSNKAIEALGCYAMNAGMAFQIVDDLLGLTAEETKLGKPLGSDLREEKKTLPIIRHLQQSSSKEKEMLRSHLGRELTKTELEEAKRLLSKSGSMDYSSKKAEAYLNKSLECLTTLPPTPARDRLHQLAEFLVSRQF